MMILSHLGRHLVMQGLLAGFAFFRDIAQIAIPVFHILLEIAEQALGILGTVLGTEDDFPDQRLVLGRQMDGRVGIVQPFETDLEELHHPVELGQLPFRDVGEPVDDGLRGILRQQLLQDGQARLHVLPGHLVLGGDGERGGVLSPEFAVVFGPVHHPADGPVHTVQLPEELGRLVVGDDVQGREPGDVDPDPVPHLGQFARRLRRLDDGRREVLQAGPVFPVHRVEAFHALHQRRGARQQHGRRVAMPDGLHIVPERLEGIQHLVRFRNVLHGIVRHEAGLQTDREENERGIHVLTADGKGGVFLQYILIVVHNRSYLLSSGRISLSSSCRRFKSWLGLGTTCMPEPFPARLPDPSSSSSSRWRSLTTRYPLST